MAIEVLISQMPPGWEALTLGEACARGGGDIQTGPFGSQLHAADYVSVGIPSVMPTNIGDNRIIEEGIARISQEDAKRLSRYLVQPGDVIYSRRGDVERRAIVRESEAGWLCGTGCLRARFGESSPVVPLYASYYLGHPKVRAWIVQHAIGATMPNLNTSILSHVPFVLPPKKWQEQVAHVLGTLDDKIELNRRMNRTLEEIARTLFKSWFVDFDPVRAKAEGRPPEGMDAETAALFPDAFEESDLGPIPKEWIVMKLGSVTNVLRRGIAPKYVESGGVTVVNQKCIRDGRLNFDLARRHDPRQRSIEGREIKHLDTLINSTGVGTLGRVSVVPALREATVVDSHVTVLRADSEHLTPLFLGFSVRHRQPEIEALGEGSTGQTELSRKLLSQLLLVVPDMPPQRAFAVTASQIRRQMELNDSQAATLGAARDTLLPKLLSGELRVADPERFLQENGP